jgi:hypothetical protein
MQRRMTIRSDPPGALVYVDDYEIGTTPVSTNFVYYGKRKIQLVKDGYETLTVLQNIPTPWYEYFPFEFVAENFALGDIHDKHVIDFQLKPQVVVPTDQLIGRAEILRRGNAVAPAGAMTPRPGGMTPPIQPGAPATAPAPVFSPTPTPMPVSTPPPTPNYPPAGTMPSTASPPSGAAPSSNLIPLPGPM